MKICFICGNKEGLYDNSKTMSENLDAYRVPPMKFFKIDGADCCADCYTENEKKKTFYKEFGIREVAQKISSYLGGL